MAFNDFVRKGLAMIILAVILETSCTPADAKPTPIPEPTKKIKAAFVSTPTTLIDPLPNFLNEYQRSCSTPEECGKKLIDLGWTYVRDGNIASPLTFLKLKKGDCGDLVTTLAFGVEDNGFASYFLVLISKDSGNIHNIYPFESADGLWGYVNLTNNLMEYKEPQFMSMDELFLGYKNSHPSLDYYEYFLYDLNKPEMTNALKEASYGIENWRTTERSIPLISQGLIDLGLNMDSVFK
jgi:hypothetical protein